MNPSHSIPKNLIYFAIINYLPTSSFLSLKVCNLILFLKYLLFNHIINPRLFLFFKLNQELCNSISKHFLLLLTYIFKIQILQIIKLLKINI